MMSHLISFLTNSSCHYDLIINQQDVSVQNTIPFDFHDYVLWSSNIWQRIKNTFALVISISNIEHPTDLPLGPKDIQSILTHMTLFSGPILLLCAYDFAIQWSTCLQLVLYCLHIGAITRAHTHTHTFQNANKI